MTDQTPRSLVDEPNGAAKDGEEDRLTEHGQAPNIAVEQAEDSSDDQAPYGDADNALGKRHRALIAELRGWRIDWRNTCRGSLDP